MWNKNLILNRPETRVFCVISDYHEGCDQREPLISSTNKHEFCDEKI